MKQKKEKENNLMNNLLSNTQLIKAENKTTKVCLGQLFVEA